MGHVWLYLLAGALALLILLFAYLARRQVLSRRVNGDAGLAAANVELERRVAERTAELAESRRFAHRIADVMPNMLYVHDIQQNRNIYINHEMFASLGHRRDFFERWGSQATSMLMHPEDLPRFIEHMQAVAKLSDGRVAEFTYRMRTAAGAWRWFYSRDAVFARSPDGAVQQVIGTATDVTMIKAAEAAVRENNQRLEFVLSAASMGVWELNLETGAVVWTEAVAKLFDVPLNRAPRTLEEFYALLPEHERDEHRAYFEHAFTTGAPYQTEFRLDLPSGRVKWVAALGKSSYHASGRPLRLLGLAWDVTQRKREEGERARLEAQLRQSQKMEALGALAGGIAHDFNNVLTAISGNAMLALEEMSPDHAAYTSVEEIKRSAGRAADLVRRILAFSRKDDSLVLRPIDLRSIVEEAARLLRATLPAMIDIRIECAGDLPPVMADATQMHQVIMNLGANARDAMAERGGLLRIKLRQTPVNGHLTVLAPDLRQRGCVCLTVSDTGPGVDEEMLERIFEPFFTTKPPGQGTGMGLAVVHGIVRRHGGVILVNSRPGEGASFDIYLPVAQNIAEPAQAQSGAHPRGRGERILYVDDEEPLVFLATRMLTRMGFEVEGRVDAAEALELVREAPDRFDLVITDLGMPGMSGLEFTAELLRLRPGLPVILTSGYVRTEDAERARAIGARDIVLKPNTVEEMGQLITQLIERLRAEAHRTPAS